MAERGFYHPLRGYWQTTNEPPQHILDGYPAGTVEVPLKPGADYEWTGSAWVEMPPDPAEVLAAKRATWVASAMQIKLALLEVNRLQDVENAVKSGTLQVQIAWDKATEFRRLSPTIAALAPGAGFTDAEIDALFVRAMEIEA